MIKCLISLRNGDESLFEHIFLGHFNDNIKYLRSNFRLSYEDAYDVCLDTLVEFYEKLKIGTIQYGNLNFLFHQMSKNNYLQRLRRKKVHKRALSEVLTFNQLDVKEKHKLLDLIDRAWEYLGEECKGLLRKFYFENHDYNKLAIGVSENKCSH